MNRETIRVLHASLDRVEIEVSIHGPTGVIGLLTCRLTAEEAGKLSIDLADAVKKAVGKQ